MAVAWASLGVLTAISVTFFVYLGTKIDALGARIDSRIDSLGARIDALGADLGARIDALSARLDAHLDGHLHAG